MVIIYSYSVYVINFKLKCIIYLYLSIDEEPKTDVMRCVPFSWCIPAKVAPTKIWDDSGAGGGKPGSIWTINSYDMITVIPGHEPPKESFYEVSSNKFFLDTFM